MEGMSEPTADDRRQFLILIVGSLLINLAAAWWTTHAVRPSEAVPAGEALIDTSVDSKGRVWGTPIAETGPQAPSKVIINTADRPALLACPGIGPIIADRIIAERREMPFRSWDDLQQRVPGLGPAKINQLRIDGIRLDEEP